MKKLHKLTVLTIILCCANYGSIFAQGERKAFEEGDKILGFTVGGSYGKQIGLNGTLGASYETAIKGTNGLLSIGGFAELERTQQIFSSQSQSLPSSFDVRNISGGVKLALHYSPNSKWDLYAGTRIGATYSSALGISGDLISNKIPINGGNTLDKLNLILDPYIGARYYFTKKVGLQLETTGKQTTFGIVIKF
jgi:hypothetical protein